MKVKSIKNAAVWGRNDPCPFCPSGKKYKKCCLPMVERWGQEESHIVKDVRKKDQKYWNKRYKRLTNGI